MHPKRLKILPGASGKLAIHDLTTNDQSKKLDLIDQVRNGLPTSFVASLAEHEVLSNAEIDRVVIPRKTLKHRESLGRLTADQSDRALRVVRVIALTQETFGTPEKAGIWLRKPSRALNGHTPLDLLDTEIGAHQVEELLGRIAHGLAA
jgi:putative toxin-antitoxin system antitoxin component (TIGR02293 family)